VLSRASSLYPDAVHFGNVAPPSAPIDTFNIPPEYDGVYKYTLYVEKGYTFVE
jgi:hypothetical protein